MMEDKSRQDIVKEYNDFYRKKPNKWASVLRNDFAMKAIENHLGRGPASVIDVGCGVGHTVEYLAARWRGTTFAGLDPSDEAVRICKRRVPSAKFFCGFLGDEIEGLGKYEAVIMLGVLEHIEKTRDALKAVRKLVDRGGLLYVEVPNCISYPESVHEEGFRRITVGNHQFEWHRWRETWEGLFERNDFRIAEALTGPTIQMEFVWILEKV